MSDPTVSSVIRRRRMVRAFETTPIDPAMVDELCDLARRAPSAGNTQSVEFLVLEGPMTAAYWDVTMPADVRARFRFPGLVRAPVLVVVYVRPASYVARYAEPDKSATGLGASSGAWPVPYWWVDGGAVVENLLLAANSVGLGACFFGQFEHEDAIRRRFGIAPDRRAVGTVALGLPAEDPPGASVTRPRPDLSDVITRPVH